jgi:2-polyprenyl-3-methyl-5-hydroxy-6-metoxy-1,4-benzoquinol methylase
MSLDHDRNQELLSRYGKYLSEEDGVILPRTEFITLLHGDIREKEIRQRIMKVDCVLSNSVFEHLGDVHGLTHALAGLTQPDGAHLHFVDLRDHYFKYPFEMLAYSEFVWKNLLNPTSNLNRFRLKDYRRVFHDEFELVDIHVLERLEAEFRAARARIRLEFLSGDPSVDSVSLIRVYAERPRN